MNYSEKLIPHFEWLNNSKCIAGFSTRKGGISTGVYQSLNLGMHSKDNHANVIQNRKLFFDAVAPQSSIVYLHQIHSAKVVRVDSLFKNDTEADGFFTTEKNILLTVSIADCGSVLFHDDNFTIVAGLHCGWRGTRDGIIQNMIAELSKFVEPQKLNAYIGPMIGQENYEVGNEFLDYFSNDFLIRKKDNKLLFDLNGQVECILKNSGIEKISNARMDTFSNENNFFSYRRDSQTGRMCSYIGLM